MKKFLAIPQELIAEQTDERGSGIYFLDLNDRLRNQILAHVENESGIFTFLDEEGKVIREESGLFKKSFFNRPMATAFILFIRKVPFSREMTNFFLAKTEDRDRYEILSNTDKGCPEKAFSLVIQVKRGTFDD